MSNITKVAKQLAEANPKISKAYKYDLVMREFDNKIELIGLVDDQVRGRAFDVDRGQASVQDAHRLE